MRLTVAHSSRPSIAALLAALMSALVVHYPHVAVAQDLEGSYLDPKRISRQVMRAGARRSADQVGRYGTDNAFGSMISLPPLPGEQGFADSSNNPEDYFEEGQVPDLGLNQRGNVNINLPPLKGLRQILDSSVTEQLLKDLTSSKVTVLTQTYMMVENGAATGFMGGMNIGSNLMSNMLQSQDYQLKLLEATDDTGKMKEAYVQRVASVLRNPQYKDVWPAALYIASGEDGGSQNLKTMDDLSLGKDPYDLEGLKINSGTGDNKTRRLSDLLFNDVTVEGVAQGTTKYQNEQLNEIRADFRDLVGDVEIKLEDGQTSKLARNVGINLIPPTFTGAASGGGAGGGSRRGIAAINWEEVQVGWRSINKILFDICEYHRRNQNANGTVYQLSSIETDGQIGQQDNGFENLWELASGPDVPFTLSTAEQLYLFVKEYQDPQNPNCQALRLTEKDIPEDTATNMDKANFNDCGPNKGCKKNRIVLSLAYLAARSRTLHMYRELYLISKKFAVDPFLNELVDRLFYKTLAGMDINAAIEDNAQRHRAYLAYMAELAQSSVGTGGFYRGGSSSAYQPAAVGLGNGGGSGR